MQDTVNHKVIKHDWKLAVVMLGALMVQAVCGIHLMTNDL